MTSTSPDTRPAHSSAWLRRVRAFPAHALIFVIQLYRMYVSPLKLPTCRFVPTCSEYAVDALREFGLLRGSWLTGVRLLKCGPWHPGGWDPVPERHAGHLNQPVTDGAEQPAEAARCGCSPNPDEQRSA